MKSFLTNLVSHDGVKDSLTGLLTISAFLEIATREVAVSQRSGKAISLSIISLCDTDSLGERGLVVTEGKDIVQKSEDELVRIATRVVEITKSLEKTFRIGDPICRYTFADFLLLHEGDMKTIVEKLGGIATMHEAVTATIPIYNHVHNQMNQRSDKLNLQSIKNGRDGLHNILISNISILEEQILDEVKKARN